MDSRMALIDLDIRLVLLQYGELDELETLHETLCLEFEDDHITFEEVCEWNSLALEISDLEQSFDTCYTNANYE
jgi:hypothetical protein